MYVCSFENVAVTAAQDFFEISPADDKPVLIHAVYLSQSSDVGDAAEEILRVTIKRGHTSSGSGGSAFTPVPLTSSAGAAAGAASEINNTTIASAGTAVVLHAETFNIRSGWVYIPTPETRPGASQANTTIVVRLEAAPADSLSMSGTLVFEELG
jgi:hypothetical protein